MILSNRREFALSASAALLAAKASGSASDRLRLGVIGAGVRGRYLMNVFREFPDVEIAMISDVLEPRMDEAFDGISSGPKAQRPERVVDYRRILDRKDIDAVIVATPEHWHGLPTIHAAQAGKHVFVEKPLSHTVVEGRAMVNAVKKHGVVAQMGTQQRCGAHYRRAVETIQSGRLGKIALVECWNCGNVGQRLGRPPDSDPPTGYHWDLWLGPAPAVQFNPARLRHSSWFDYGGGMMTVWAVHHIDIILWAMQVDSPKSAVCTGGKYVVDDIADAPDTIQADWEFPGFVMRYIYRGASNFPVVQSRPQRHGIAFYGTQATLVISRSGYEIWSDAKPEDRIEAVKADPTFFPGITYPNEQDGPYHRWFVDAVKQNKPAPITLEESHRSTVCALLGNIAYHTRRRVYWDGATEEIPGDGEASRLLQRPRRRGFELPAGVTGGNDR